MLFPNRKQYQTAPKDYGCWKVFRMKNSPGKEQLLVHQLIVPFHVDTCPEASLGHQNHNPFRTKHITTRVKKDISDKNPSLKFKTDWNNKINIWGHLFMVGESN